MTLLSRFSWLPVLAMGIGSTFTYKPVGGGGVSVWIYSLKSNMGLSKCINTYLQDFLFSLFNLKQQIQFAFNPV